MRSADAIVRAAGLNPPDDENSPQQRTENTLVMTFWTHMIIVWPVNNNLNLNLVLIELEAVLEVFHFGLAI